MPEAGTSKGSYTWTHLRHMVGIMACSADRGLATAVMVGMLLASSLAQADPVEDAGPLPPRALTAEATESGIQLAWNSPSGPVDGYLVYRAEDAQAIVLDGVAAFSLIGQTEAPAFLDIATGEGPVYVVTAIHQDRESPPSNPAGYPYCLELHPSCFLPIPIS